jgi:hypothetical protein
MIDSIDNFQLQNFGKRDSDLFRRNSYLGFPVLIIAKTGNL